MCCLYVIIFIRFFSIMICYLLIDFPLYKYEYIQRDSTVYWLLFQELYMFRAFAMSIIRITLLHTQPLV
jgi:hypothetical protein